jgi:hypothetical protein
MQYGLGALHKAAFSETGAISQRANVRRQACRLKYKEG